MENDEINKLVHEKVMGECVHNPNEFAVGMLMCTECNSILDDADLMDDLPDYAGNIAESWRVIKKMRPEFFLNLHSSKYHIATFKDEKGFSYVAQADSPSKAICLAALKAKGIETE